MKKVKYAQVGNLFVDCGQFVVLPQTLLERYQANTGEYIDRRRLEYKPTGAEIDPRFLRNWDAVIPEYGLSANELARRGELTLISPKVHRPGLSYQEISEATIYGDHSGSLLYSGGAPIGFAQSACYGDGVYPVSLGTRGQEIVSLLVNTTPDVEPKANMGAAYYRGTFDVNEPLWVVDPCYRERRFALRVNLDLGKYDVFVVWQGGETPRTSRPTGLVLMKVGIWSQKTTG